MPGSLLDAAATFCQALAGFDPALHRGEDCVRIVTALCRVVNAADAARAAAAARAAECGTHRARGFLDPDDWYARQAGLTPSQARCDRLTTELARQHPKTSQAMRAGQVSLGQAAEITRTTETRPDAEDELLAAAAALPLPLLKDTARRLRQEHLDPDELHARQHRARSFRHWRDELGMTRFSGALPPEAGVPFTNRLDTETRRLRHPHDPDPWEATAADAFAAMISGTGKGQATAADVVLVCDLAAYQRGHTQPGETSHIIGGGPILVARVRHWLEHNDAFLKVVLHDGTKIDTIKHFGRHINAELRTALALGPPPTFDGATCGCGCGLRHNLQIDHIDPLANQGSTSHDNLQPLTPGHHTAKTSNDRRAGLLRPRANRRSRRRSPAGASPAPAPTATATAGTQAPGGPGPAPTDERGPP